MSVFAGTIETEKVRAARMGYIKQFDAIRALAVMMVVVSHWGDSLPSMVRNRLGSFGVDTFFVLSGFLITTILLRHKEEDKIKILKAFYVRRVLRIFPIYYLIIFVVLLGTNVKLPAWYLLTYTSNFYFYNIRHFDNILFHFWSLSVEEQFYLIWPFFMLYIPIKYIPWCIGIFIVLGLTSQYITGTTFISSVLTINCFYAFGLGALLSWIAGHQAIYLRKFFVGVIVAALISITGVIFSFYYTVENYRVIRIENVMIALLIMTFIVINQHKQSFPFKYILNNRLLVFLGKMSYGIYVYHTSIPLITQRLAGNQIFHHLLDTLPGVNKDIAITICNTILLIAVAWCSYHYIEKPIVDYKRKFEY